MATVSTFISGATAASGLDNLVVISRNVLDFSATGAAASDVVQAIKVSAGTVINLVQVRIITAEGGTATCDVGDGSDANGYDDAVNLNATAGTITRTLEADAYSAGKYYSSDDTIDLTLDHTLDTAVIEVVAYGRQALDSI